MKRKLIQKASWFIALLLAFCLVFVGCDLFAVFGIVHRRIRAYFLRICGEQPRRGALCQAKYQELDTGGGTDLFVGGLFVVHCTVYYYCINRSRVKGGFGYG